MGRRGLFAGTVSAYGGTRQLAHPRHVMIPDTGLHLVEEAGDADRDREDGRWSNGPIHDIERALILGEARTEELP